LVPVRPTACSPVSEHRGVGAGRRRLGRGRRLRRPAALHRLVEALQQLRPLDRARQRGNAKRRIGIADQHRGLRIAGADRLELGHRLRIAAVDEIEVGGTRAGGAALGEARVAPRRQAEDDREQQALGRVEPDHVYAVAVVGACHLCASPSFPL
jgi:hypothetical protein